MKVYRAGEEVYAFRNTGKEPFPDWIRDIIKDGSAKVEYDNGEDGGKLSSIRNDVDEWMDMTESSVVTHPLDPLMYESVCYETISEYLESNVFWPESEEEELELERERVQRKFDERSEALANSKDENEAREIGEALKAMAPYLDWLTRKTCL